MHRGRDRSPIKANDAVDADLLCGATSSSRSSKSSIFRSSIKKSKSETQRETSRFSFRKSKNHSEDLSRKRENCQCCEQQRQEQTQRIRALEESHEVLRNVLEQKENDLRQRVMLVKQLVEENRQLKKRQNYLRYERQILEQKQKIRALEEAYDEQLRFRLEQKENELQQSRERMMEMNKLKRENHVLKCEIEQLQHRNGTSKGQCCEVKAQEYKQIMSEMETFYKAKVTEARLALKEEKEQFRSFKDRVAENVAPTIKKDNTENMNNPVNQTRLTEMFQQLRVCTWPNIHFTSSDREARKLVRDMFARAAEHMGRYVQIVKASSPKVEKIIQSGLENLQLALYHSSKQDVFQAAFPHFEKGPAEVQLASECYWLGCLMALHSPPLHPEWGQDGRTVFPRDIRLQRQIQHTHV